MNRRLRNRLAATLFIGVGFVVLGGVVENMVVAVLGLVVMATAAFVE